MEHEDGHRYFEGLAVAHVLGGLDDSEGRVFRAHLLECGSCRARVGELRAIAHDLADVERDERRVRAAQAIDTKRRETEDDDDAPAEAVPSPRSSRITVVVGLILIIGLSLWNFTLRGALTVQETRNKTLVEMGVLADSGVAWTVVRSEGSVDASVKSKGDQFLLTMDGLDDRQIYGMYIQNDEDVVLVQYDFSPDEGRVYHQFDLPDGADHITISNPIDDDGGDVARPGKTPSGVMVFEATRPIG